MQVEKQLSKDKGWSWAMERGWRETVDVRMTGHTEFLCTGSSSLLLALSCDTNGVF